MAFWYFDSVLGSDSNPGDTEAAPKQHYNNFNLSSASLGDTFLFKRGTTQVISTLYKGIKGGSGSGAKSLYATYGVGRVAHAFFVNPSAVGGMVLNGAGVSYFKMHDLHFPDLGDNRRAVYAVAQGSSNCNEWEIRRCLFADSDLGSGMGIGVEDGSTGQSVGHVIEDSMFIGNGAHGLALTCSDSTVSRCNFVGNGARGIDGGHGFTALYRRNSTTSGWEPVTGKCYRLALPAYVTDVHFVKWAYPYTRVQKNTTTPTTPAAGEFGFDSGWLYINIAVNPNGKTIWYAHGATTGLVVQDCKAWGNIASPVAPWHEGHGFAFDDFASSSQFLRCQSYDNEGLGYSINGGDNNSVISCIAMDNYYGAVGSATGAGNLVDHGTFKNNNRAGLSVADVNFAYQGRNNTIRNSILVGAGAAVSAPSGIGNVMTHNICHGYATNATGVTEQNAVAGDPLLDARLRPADTSPSKNAALAGSAVYDREGWKQDVTPDIGALIAA